MKHLNDHPSAWAPIEAINLAWLGASPADRCGSFPARAATGTSGVDALADTHLFGGGADRQATIAAVQVESHRWDTATCHFAMP
jgi:hypothetical protein